MITAFSVFAGPQVVLLVPWSGPTQAAETLPVTLSTSIEYRLRTPMAKISGFALPLVTASLFGGNRFGPFGAVAPGIVYDVPMPGLLTGGLFAGVIRCSLPSQAFVLPEVWRASP